MSSIAFEATLWSKVCLAGLKPIFTLLPTLLLYTPVSTHMYAYIISGRGPGIKLRVQSRGSYHCISRQLGSHSCLHVERGHLFPFSMVRMQGRWWIYSLLHQLFSQYRSEGLWVRLPVPCPFYPPSHPRTPSCSALKGHIADDWRTDCLLVTSTLSSVGMAYCQRWRHLMARFVTETQAVWVSHLRWAQ